MSKSAAIGLTILFRDYDHEKGRLDLAHAVNIARAEEHF